MESMRKVIEERKANTNKSIEFLWKKMEERDECANQQMEVLRAMFTSFMTRLNGDREDPSFDHDKVGGLGLSMNHKERSVQREEKQVVEDEVKLWARRKIELLNFDGSDPNGWLLRAEKFFEIHEVC